MIKKPETSEMCPTGFHVVHGFERICHSGTRAWVDTHIRKNRGKIKPGLLKENIWYLFWTSTKTYPVLKKISSKDKEPDFDKMIHFWLDYWKSQGVKFPDDLNALLIKALIYVESTFDSNAKAPSSKSTAEGLMQVTDQSLRVLGGYPNKAKWIEARTNLIHVEKKDKFDPVVSIALGIRLLGHKYSQIPSNYPKNAESTIIGYHSFDTKGEDYAKKVFDTYKKAQNGW